MSVTRVTDDDSGLPGEVPGLIAILQENQSGMFGNELASRGSSISAFTEDDEYDSDEVASFTRGDSAQEHWDESMRQLEQVFTCVLFPVVGRVLGRRMAQNLWVAWVDSRYLKSLASTAIN